MPKHWSIANAVIQRVVELEYTPPEDFPENMVMCTTDELRSIVEEEASTSGPASRPSSPTELTERLQELVRTVIVEQRMIATRASDRDAIASAGRDGKAAFQAVESLVEARTREIERLNRRLDEYVEAEAMICPEDWGFVEYTKHLKAKAEELEIKLIAARALSSKGQP